MEVVVNVKWPKVEQESQNHVNSTSYRLVIDRIYVIFFFIIIQSIWYYFDFLSFKDGFRTIPWNSVSRWE